LDIKNKSINNIKFSELLLHLEGNYNEIVSIFCENDNNIFMIYNSNFPNFIELKSKIKSFEEKENPLSNSIKSIISTNFFRFVEYNNLNNHNNFNNLSFEKKITDFRIQSDSSENEKKIKILTSSFNKNFHIFQNNLAALEFIKYGGINYLSLLLEYYYQILSHILENINSYQKKEIKEICQKINQKILNNISFFNINVININFNFRMINPINKYFYQMSTTLMKFLELSMINTETIVAILYLFNSFDCLKRKNDYELLKYNLFIFLLNPQLYNNKDEFIMEKLHCLMQNLLIIIKAQSKKKTEFINKILNIDIIN
jgi:hypothetical protein